MKHRSIVSLGVSTRNDVYYDGYGNIWKILQVFFDGWLIKTGRKITSVFEMGMGGNIIWIILETVQTDDISGLIDSIWSSQEAIYSHSINYDKDIDYLHPSPSPFSILLNTRIRDVVNDENYH